MEIAVECLLEAFALFAFFKNICLSFCGTYLGLVGIPVGLAHFALGFSKKIFLDSPNSVSTLRGSYDKCKGWCLIRVLQLWHGIFPCKFLYEVALVKSPSAFQLRRLAQSVCPGFGARHSNFCKKLLL